MLESIKKIGIPTAITAALVLMAPSLLTTGVYAANPHFVGTPTCEITSAGALECSGKIAGLGSVSQVTAFLQADSTCTNRGGNNPPGQVTGPSETLTVRNGQTVFDLAIPNPCPDKMTSTFANVAVVVDGNVLPISFP
jgi:hypothetical protein